MKILCVGAGLANASCIHFIKKQLKPKNIKPIFDVIDQRSHIGGNCFTKVDQESGITLHQYGPHIFNTNSESAWGFINEYLTMHPFTNRVKAATSKGIFSMPINLHTINQLFNKSMSVSEATEFMARITAYFKTSSPANFEAAMLSHLGEELYSEFIYGYTKKQWGVEPKELPASIAKRLPFRLTYNDNYYNKKYQGLPEEGYTTLFEKIFAPKDISLNLNTPYNHDMARDYDLVLFSGPIDQFFNCEFGELSYRTVYWEKKRCQGIFQGNAVINYTDFDVPFTRINEPFFFEPWRTELPRCQSIYLIEYSKKTGQEDEPYYPIRLKEDQKRLELYQQKALSPGYENIVFLGRLGTYRYLDMDVTIQESEKLASQIAFKASKSA